MYDIARTGRLTDVGFLAAVFSLIDKKNALHSLGQPQGGCGYSRACRCRKKRGEHAHAQIFRMKKDR